MRPTVDRNVRNGALRRPCQANPFVERADRESHGENLSDQVFFWYAVDFRDGQLLKVTGTTTIMARRRMHR